VKKDRFLTRVKVRQWVVRHTLCLQRFYINREDAKQLTVAIFRIIALALQAIWYGKKDRDREASQSISID
jgi:hypothetical protein